MAGNLRVHRLLRLAGIRSEMAQLPGLHWPLQLHLDSRVLGRDRARV